MRAAAADGFTLIELVIATAISLIIGGVLVTCVIVGLKNADAAGQRLTNSHDAQIAQSYFTTDATSADLVDIDATDNSCTDSVTDVLLVRFRWAVRPANATSANTYQIAAYRTRTSGGERQIVRQFCSGSSFSLASLVSTVVLAHGLDPAVTASVTCTTRNSSVLGSCVSVTGANPFKTVRLSAQSIQQGTESADSLAYVLNGARRSAQ
jgi:prepilin-type N-terminal cleavage/methylation domain-containing protein